jgi:hypothetical protein
MGRFEAEGWRGRKTSLLSPTCRANGIDAVRKRRQAQVVVLDIGSSESPTYGDQEGTALQWAFRLYLLPSAVCVQSTRLSGAVCPSLRQRPQLLWLARGSGVGDGPLPRNGEASLLPWRDGLPIPKFYEFIEAKGIGYTIRLPANGPFRTAYCAPARDFRCQGSSRARSWPQHLGNLGKVGLCVVVDQPVEMV